MRCQFRHDGADAQAPFGVAVGLGVSNPRRPSPRGEEPPPRATSCHPHGTLCPEGHASQGASAGSPRPHAAPTACGQRTPTACRAAGGSSRGGEKIFVTPAEPNVHEDPLWSWGPLYFKKWRLAVGGPWERS